ncbi:hypothetical protein [Dactylosporangium sp. NPDC050588]|uniref:hypothetical protein n=1 Tax=Dactylosporangium sp. NPDC050588 TaxID=3157211 RepID=UPI0033D0BD31
MTVLFVLAVAAARDRARQAALVAPGRPAGRAGVAGPLHELAVLLLDEGRPGDALESARTAIAAWRAVLADDPDYYSGELAGTLAVHARALWAVGRRGEALAAGLEAADRFRDLLPASRADLIRALLLVSGFRRDEDALPHALEAVELAREAAPELLARALARLAAVHTGLGRADDAAAATREGLAVWLRAEPASGLLEPEDAGVLTGLAAALASNGRPGVAVEVMSAVATAYRRRIRTFRLIDGPAGPAATSDARQLRHHLRTRLRDTLRARAAYHSKR